MNEILINDATSTASRNGLSRLMMSIALGKFVEPDGKKLATNDYIGWAKNARLLIVTITLSTANTTGKQKFWRRLNGKKGKGTV